MSDKDFQRRMATVPMPVQELGSLYRSAVASKELLDTLAGQTPSVGDAAVTFNDLVRFGLIDRARVPKQLG
jgi:hypothetical protein